jgi:hypothetical protein
LSKGAAAGKNEYQKEKAFHLTSHDGWKSPIVAHHPITTADSSGPKPSRNNNSEIGGGVGSLGRNLQFLLTIDTRNCMVTHYASPFGYTYCREEFASDDPRGLDQSCWNHGSVRRRVQCLGRSYPPRGP